MNPRSPLSLMYHSYHASKLVEVYAVRALATRLPVAKSGIIVNLLDPGFCNTELLRNVGLINRIRFALLRLIFARSAEMGSRTLLHASVAGEESHGKYCSDCEIKESVRRLCRAQALSTRSPLADVIRRHSVSPFVRSEEGQKMQEKVWTQLAAQLEKIEPGCVTQALEYGQT